MEPTDRVRHRALCGARPSPSRSTRAALLLALLTASCSGDPVSPISLPDEASIPLAVPDAARSAQSYAKRCAGCHGDPTWPGPGVAPRDIFGTLTTDLAAHRDQHFDALAQEERWGVAFFALARRHDETDAARGQTIADRLAPAAITPASLAGADDAGIEDRLENIELGTERRDLAAYMRRVAPFVDRGTLATTRAWLARSLSRYRRGEHLAARRLARRAHLAGFAAAALPLRRIAPEQERDLDAAFLALRADLDAGAPASDIETHAAGIARDLYRVDHALAEPRPASTTGARAALVTAAAFADGLLVLLLLCAIVRRRGASRSELDALVLGVGAGVLGAAVLAATWSAGASAIAGAPLVALDAAFAAAMLLAVVASVPAAVEHFFAPRRSPPPALSWLALLAGAAALLIVRDALTAIPSLRLLAAGGGRSPVVGGAALGLGLALIAILVVVEVGRRLGSDVRLSGFAIVATAAAIIGAGRAALALGALGVTSTTALGTARAPALGIAATVETTIAQGAAALIVAAALAWSGWRATRAAAAAS